MLPPKQSGEETLPAEVHETCGQHLWTYDAATASWACVAQLAPILNQPAINSKRGMFRINTRFRDGVQQQTLIISGAIKDGREGADRIPSNGTMLTTDRLKPVPVVGGLAAKSCLS